MPPPRLLRPLVGVVLALLLAACGAGDQVVTAEMLPTVPPDLRPAASPPPEPTASAPTGPTPTPTEPPTATVSPSPPTPDATDAAYPSSGGL